MRAVGVFGPVETDVAAAKHKSAPTLPLFVPDLTTLSYGAFWISVGILFWCVKRIPMTAAAASRSHRA